MKRNRRFYSNICMFLLAVMLVLSAIPVYAVGGLEDRTEQDYSGIDNWPQAPEIMGEGAFLIEINSGAILYSKNADTHFYPASITKILTALVVIENCSLDEQVTFSYEAIHDLEEGAYSYMADTGDILSVEDLLYAMMLQSSNEAAYALAEHCGGSVSGFAEMMNAKAAELGASNSHFANSHGLFNEEHYTTPHDMAKIMWAALQNETFLTIDSTVSYTTAPTTTQPEGYYCQMRHSMMRSTTEYYNSYVVAGKTGYIEKAKNTLVTYAVRGDMELISVVMRSDGSGQVYQDTQALLDYGFNNFSYQSISQNVDMGTLEVQMADITERVVQNFDISNEAKALLPVEGGLDDIETVFQVYPDTLSGDQMDGRLVYSCQGYELGADPVVIRFVPESAKEETNADGGNRLVVPDKSEDGRDMSAIVGIVICAVVVILVLVLLLQLINMIRRRRRRKKRRQARKRKNREE